MTTLFVSSLICGVLWSWTNPAFGREAEKAHVLGRAKKHGMHVVIEAVLSVATDQLPLSSRSDMQLPWQQLLKCVIGYLGAWKKGIVAVCV